MASKKDQPMLDPIAYRKDYPEEAIIGGKANESFNQFGDDSDLAHQQQSLGGLNEKYEGEGTFNYNKDANIKDLPSYVYGRDTAKQANGYITQRNDNIASALYNEGVTSKDAIVSYLASQEGWNNSSEMDRINTVEAIWKRMGQLVEPQNEEKKEGVDTSKMESDLNKSSNDVIYGKTTADSGNPEGGIKVNNDANLAYDIDAQARIANVKMLLGMDSTVIAASMIGGNDFKEQTITDLQSWYPEKYQEIMDAKKQIIGQMTVDSITKGETLVTASNTVNTNSAKTNAAVQNATLTVSATQLLKAVDAALESNDTAKSAEDLMGSLEKDMATLKNRLLNLRKEANTVFKGDAPDYIVNAYINNKSQEIQNQLSILENRWESANNRYQKEADRALEKEKIQIQKDNLDLEWYKAKNSSKTTTTNEDKDYTVAERNNNPTNMTVDWMEWAGAELGVDYEISTDSFVNSNLGRQYYAKLIGDPLDATINVLNKAIANGKNPFNTTSWSYMGQLGMTVDKWNNMSDEEKKKFITNQWLPREGGNIDNMKYYVDNPGVQWTSNTSGYGYKGFEFGFDTRLEPLFKTYMDSGKLGGNASTYNQIKNLTGYSDQEIGVQLKNWQNYNQNQFNSAGINVLEAMAAFWLAADTYDTTDDKGNTKTVFDKTWTWDYGIGGGDARAALEDIFNEKLLQRYVEARQRGVSFGSTTEAEWDIMKATNRLQKNVKFSSSDEDFTDAYKDLLQGVWEETFHTKYNESDWKQYLEDMKAGRTNINVALLTNDTTGVRQNPQNSDDAISKTFSGFQTGNNQGTGLPSISNIGKR